MSIYEASITNPKKQLEFYKDLSERLQRENKILKENAEHNDKVVDKVNWENMLLKKENKQLQDNWNKLKEFMSYENISRLFNMGYDINDFINEIDGKIKELEDAGIG